MIIDQTSISTLTCCFAQLIYQFQVPLQQHSPSLSRRKLMVYQLISETKFHPEMQGSKVILRLLNRKYIVSNTYLSALDNKFACMLGQDTERDAFSF